MNDGAHTDDGSEMNSSARNVHMSAYTHPHAGVIL